MDDFLALDETTPVDKKLRDITYALDQSSAVVITDQTGKIIYANDKFTEISQYEPSELLGQTHRVVNSGHHPKSFFNQMWATISQGTIWRDEIKNRKKDGSIYWVDTTIVPFLNEDNKPYQYVSIRTDVTDRRMAEEMIWNLAYNDQLTELPNRFSFRRQLYQQMETAQYSGQKFALVFLNIDRLRYVNDTFGHVAGDHILSVVAERLKRVLPAQHVISRISGDEFAFILKDMRDAENAVQITRDVMEALIKPLSVVGQSYTLSISFGITLYPDHAKDVEELTTRAEKALYEVKKRGGAGYELYQHEVAQKSIERVFLENELRKSIDLGHFTLDYQPKFDLTTRVMTSLEALVRWHHPELGRIPPDEFIQVAEETNMIVPLGEWIFEEACHQIVKWMEKGFRYQVAINVSPVQLEHPSFLSFIKRILKKTGAPTDLVQIELTESFFGNQSDMKEIIEELRAMGITVAIDDFGTGYSSFSYIKELPVDTLKIDIAFTKDIHENIESRAIVQAILSVAVAVGLNVVAEGIEYEEQLLILQELGCQEGQGYYYSKPVSPTECEQYMKVSSDY